MYFLCSGIHPTSHYHIDMDDMISDLYCKMKYFPGKTTPKGKNENNI